MNAQEQLSGLKVQLTQLLLAIEKMEILEAIKRQLDALVPNVDFWDELDPVEREAILEGLAQVEAGHYRPYKEVLSDMRT